VFVFVTMTSLVGYLRSTIVYSW